MRVPELRAAAATSSVRSLARRADGCGDDIRVGMCISGPRALADSGDEDPALVVHARRGRDPATWGFTIDALAVSEFGFTDEEAMRQARRRGASERARICSSRDQQPDPQRALALRLRLADTEGRLEEVLTDALVLDDDYAERLLREHAPEPPDPA